MLSILNNIIKVYAAIVLLWPTIRLVTVQRV